MDEIRVIDPKKLKAKRGDVPLSAIARRTKGVYSKSSIRAIEEGEFRPAPEKLSTLLKAYGVSFAEVSKPLRA